MNPKLIFALLGFAGLASVGRASVEYVDPLCRREVRVSSSDCRPCEGRVVYVEPEPCRPRSGHYDRVVRYRRDGCREIRYVFVADGRWRR